MSTLIEKIISNKINRDVRSEEIVLVDVDRIMSHDTTTPLAIEVFRKMLVKNVFDPNRLTIIFDHIVPAANLQAANLQKKVLDFAREQGINNFYNGAGVCHQVMIDEGFVTPGDVIVGGDSHSCTYGALGAFGTGVGSTDIATAWATGKLWFKVPETVEIEINGDLQKNVTSKDLTLKIVQKVTQSGATYEAVEYRGETVRNFSIPERITLSNMSIEIGAKAGLIDADEKTIEFLKTLTNKTFNQLRADENADYRTTIHIDASNLEPQVAVPPQIDNVKNISDLEEINVDQVFLGTCTNGRIEDLEIFLNVVNGRKLKTRTVVSPASNQVHLEALKRGYVEQFLKIGATFVNAGCGPCLGRHQGVLADGDVCVSTANRNYAGRMGNPNAEIYVVSPATAAATAVTGKLTDPRSI